MQVYISNLEDNVNVLMRRVKLQLLWTEHILKWQYHKVCELPHTMARRTLSS